VGLPSLWSLRERKGNVAQLCNVFVVAIGTP
jgi:hypothetical protein